MVESEIEVRGARGGDVERLVDFNLRLAAETEGKELDRETLRAGVEAVLHEAAAGGASRGRYLVAAIGGRVVAALMHTREWSDWRNGFVWWLQSVFVEPEFRRRGVFRSLYEALRREAEADATVVGLRLYVEQENRVAQATYLGLGMLQSGYVVMEEMFFETAEAAETAEDVS